MNGQSEQNASVRGPRAWQGAMHVGVPRHAPLTAGVSAGAAQQYHGVRYGAGAQGRGAGREKRTPAGPRAGACGDSKCDLGEYKGGAVTIEFLIPPGATVYAYTVN